MIYTGSITISRHLKYIQSKNEEIHAHIHRTPFQLYTWDKNGRKISMNKKSAIKMKTIPLKFCNFNFKIVLMKNNIMLAYLQPQV